ncbi:uncharacterized protein HD556DRAFT_640436 [Suillus plorans]|uniref:Uncharacterized protein n=1 Tax=Suillus plorans TaxID=116603 RepID=A0A9P7AL68_9AGAM|nr:uncharacterized protein HD556DRAFT_1061841 [Suillus plorans]XP_041158333.1 uncharacterized protein HD556DRAFT_640436 [Suillus plorans]KAG1786329.1 hypothetical protein HD556DRAFT_1061841 [Suillus plorans]KAG1791527.1 hypothetical protein HD556DRAFT_640436 [Suillus plorans]
MQLQSIIYSKPPVIVTFLLLTSLPLVDSTWVVRSLCATHLGRRLLRGFNRTLMDRLYHALSSTCLRVRLLLFPFPARSRCGTFPTLEAEAKYWCIAARYRRHLAQSSARRPPQETSEIPLVTYYTPRLLPQYRDVQHPDEGSSGFSIPAKTFCKWHRMVFRGSYHPTLAQAVVRMKYYSHRDLKEMQRIARFLSDEQVLRRPWSPKYSELWKRWLDTKGPDVVIVFE